MDRANPNKSEWSFWDYQQGSWNKDYGIRIDLFLINSHASDKVKSCKTKLSFLLRRFIMFRQGHPRKSTIRIGNVKTNTRT